MKDVTFGVKVPEDQREEINRLMKDSGLVGREFMQQLVDAYMLKQHKDEIPEMAEDIKELEDLTSRINQIYVYLGRRFQNIVKDCTKQVNKAKEENSLEKEEYSNKIDQYKKTIEEVRIKEEDLKKAYKKEKEKRKVIEEELTQLKEYNENYKELNNQYKGQIKDLTSEIEKLRNNKIQNEELTKANDTLASDLWFSKREVEKLEDQLKSAKDQFETSKKRIIDQNKLASQASVLELKLESQTKIEKLNNQMYKMQENHANKVRDLIVELEKLRNTKEKDKTK